ncbi:hypothetical protein ScPMuIL_009708 [Solemya velum]
MSDTCVYCSLVVRPRQEAILCDGCDRWQHRTCNTDISRHRYRRMVKELTAVTFRCHACSAPVNGTPIPLPPLESTRLDTSEPASPILTSIADQTTFNLSDRPSFVMPEIIQENSLTDDSIDAELSTLEAIVTYNVVDNGTQRGKRKLVSSDGHTFTLKRQNKNSTDLCCSIRNKTTTCPVVIRQQGDSYTATTDNTHTHASKPGIMTAVKIQTKTAYNERDSVYKFLRKVFALPLLPAEHILPTFTKLEEKATNDRIKDVMTYIKETWITSTVWTIPSWSVFGQHIRTNNDVEGWHNRLNQKAKKGNLQFYLLLTLLYQEARQLPVK